MDSLGPSSFDSGSHLVFYRCVGRLSVNTEYNNIGKQLSDIWVKNDMFCCESHTESL